jgi:hypothetical protein
MSDVFKIDTTEVSKVEIPQQEIKTFDLIPSDLPVLYQELPEFDFSKPQVNPNEFASTLVETVRNIMVLDYLPINVVILTEFLLWVLMIIMWHSLIQS